MAMSVPEVGNLIEGDAYRDAIHVAVAPVKAGQDLKAGDSVRIDKKDQTAIVCNARDRVGVVDPFLMTTVSKGERFWLFMTPNTVTNLRHAWTHTAFSNKIPVVEGSNE